MKLGIDKSILIIISPGTQLASNQDDEDAARKIRQADDELSEICRAHPWHFAFFASLPLPYVKGSVSKIDYALDVLGAVGCVNVHSSSSTESVEAFAPAHRYALWMRPYLNAAATGAANDGLPQEEEGLGYTVVIQVTQDPDSWRLPINMVTQTRL
ncbi:hypothetical protein PG996_013439 [Apiospora saccharicola]|uniref:Uncharacterized protein n=1 Tax=Apiospora saccharicola TaxID=335842 RepID=A0ABR1U848_9PEZI